MNRHFQKLMVANRGEIAIRILRAASELHLTTVAMYTYEDRYSLHRYKADESYQIGDNNDPLKPYLDIEEILKVAKENDVDAIHPGYGFLSENVHFARRCREEGVVFVGPDPEVMERLGDKVAAKTIARQLEVPIIEDSQKSLKREKTLIAEAERIGYPIMVKAAAGGGGRGMRVVRNREQLLIEYKEASGEALTAFGNDTIFLEKYIENPKHIEVQILGDKHGQIIHLYERDCSVQRRFQKVVEIAPALTLSPSTKDQLYEYALRIARAVEYSHAGTVEFLVDEQENIYFIEVNPRIQVEHTITEEVTGVDIVRSQILIAQGYPLSDPKINIQRQEDVSCHGFAIQCRITTEDPTQGFKPDYGTLIAYRSAAGFGIRLDAGSAYTGANISPFFDSMLVKVTAWGRTLGGAADRLYRALTEFRIRGVKTNIGFLLNLLQNETFKSGKATVGFIDNNPDILRQPRFRDRGTKTLRYLANVIVNGHPDIDARKIDQDRRFRTPGIPAFGSGDFPKGTKDELTALGPEKFAARLRKSRKVQFTDTTFRDAHQSLLATRIRTYDMLQIAESFARNHADDVFSMEVWGGATFDVSLRFLKECPWKRLELLRKAIPNILLQMLLRGSNAVGYTAYPDNLIAKFIEQAWNKGDGIDIFRIFDSLNWIQALKPSIKVVRERTDAIAEACICYTGDIADPEQHKFNLQYYLDLARRLEDAGAHILCIKDMAGLLKPYAAEELIKALRKAVDLPLHLHTHDTSSIQSATYLKAIEAGVNVVDVATSSMSGLTSQPNFNSVVAMIQGNRRAPAIDLQQLNQVANYWEVVREYYYPFETELKAGTAEVYEHEIPGGQYSNLRPQARALGLEDQFETIKKNYRLVNDLFGGIVKVTPSSKVVGDMALFMTANNLSIEEVLERGQVLAFPDSVKSLMRGDLGQMEGGFPKKIQQLVLKGEKPYRRRPNARMAPMKYKEEREDFKKQFGQYVSDRDFLSYKLYPRVFEQYQQHLETFGEVSNIPTPAFFYGLKSNEEILIPIDQGKRILVRFLNKSEADERGYRTVFFKLNGQTRSVKVRDHSVKAAVTVNRKAEKDSEIGAPLQGSLSKVLVKKGEEVAVNTPLFIIEAMKMESTITSPRAGKVKRVYLKEKTLVEQEDLVIELEDV
ncbi:MAG: pyruvate carboxylase [Bacteroidota bacterium]